jgi:hypothetical protein
LFAVLGVIAAGPSVAAGDPLPEDDLITTTTTIDITTTTTIDVPTTTEPPPVVTTTTTEPPPVITTTTTAPPPPPVLTTTTTRPPPTTRPGSTTSIPGSTSSTSGPLPSIGGPGPAAPLPSTPLTTTPVGRTFLPNLSEVFGVQFSQPVAPLVTPAGQPTAGAGQSTGRRSRIATELVTSRDNSGSSGSDDQLAIGALDSGGDHGLGNMVVLAVIFITTTACAVALWLDHLQGEGPGEEFE